MRALFIFFIHLVGCWPLYAVTLASPHAEWEALQKKMAYIQSNLKKNETQTSQLLKVLAQTDQDIHQHLQNIECLKKDIQTTTQRYEKDTQTLQKLHAQHQQASLALKQSLLWRYQLATPHPITRWLHPDAWRAFQRKTRYERDLFHAQHSLVQSIAHTLEAIKQAQAEQSRTLSTLKKHVEALQQEQDQLKAAKQHHETHIHTLHQQNQSNTLTLQHYRARQAQLQELIEKLSHTPTPSPHITTPQTASLSSPHPTLSTRYHLQDQGVLWLANEGTPVHSILPGTVMFSGWLNGYGLLLIIDHGGQLLSLYAHNKNLICRKGDHVRQNQPIATVGHSGGFFENGLYFELRRRGKIIPPRQWLTS